MTRIPLVDSNDDDADPLAREVLRRASGGRGSIEPHVFRAMANHPRALDGMMQFANVVYFDNSMTPAQRELAYLTASATNDCHY